MKITEIILSYRAKKLDNLENWLIILVIDLFVIMALCYIDILSVQRVAEKYNGTAGFTDKGEAFEASIMFYGIEVGWIVYWLRQRRIGNDKVLHLTSNLLHLKSNE